MPRLSSGVDYSPVVNNSRIEWTKLHQLEDACYLVVGTNKYRAFSPLVIVGVASPLLVAMVTVFYTMKE